MPNVSSHYRQPGWVTRNVVNRIVAGLTRRGLSIWGSRVLEVTGPVINSFGLQVIVMRIGQIHFVEETSR